MNWLNRIETEGRNQRHKLRMFTISQMAVMVSGFVRAGHVSVNSCRVIPSLLCQFQKKREWNTAAGKMSTINMGKETAAAERALCQTQGPFPS